MKPPFRLVPDPLPEDTIGAFNTLLKQAKQGQILGAAFAVMYKGKTYIVNATDEARKSPTFARGMVAELDDELARISRGNQE